MSQFPPDDPRADESPKPNPKPNPFLTPAQDIVIAEVVNEEAKAPVRQRLSLLGGIAWAAVALVVSSLVALVAMQQLSQATQVGGDATQADLMQVEIQSKIVVGQSNLDQLIPVPEGSMPETPVPPEVDTGCYEQRLVYASIKNELEGPESAREYLELLDERVEQLQAQEQLAEVPAEEQFKLTEDQQQLRDAMGELLTEYDSGQFSDSVVSEDSKNLIKERLGFPGELFLLPEGTDQQAARKGLLSGAATSVFSVFIFGAIGLLAGVVGLGCCIGFPIMIYQNKLTSYFFSSPTNHNIYIQTFAIWLVAFFSSSILLGFLELDAMTGMMIQPVIFFGSLSCLLYPLLRGVTFRQLRYDIGWTLDRPVGDSFFAGVSYMATLPCLIPGIICIAIVTAIVSQFTELHEFARQTGPGHPIQEYLANGDWLMITIVILTACIAAPIVEETMFRGVLYRHLRDWSQHWARWTSVAFSAILNGFVFAAIHPQGIATIPVLMTLAICFSLVREWRNSLLTPMLMHGVHNTLVTCISLLLL